MMETKNGERRTDLLSKSHTLIKLKQVRFSSASFFDILVHTTKTNVAY